ncbi:putative dehydrogenase [Paenibacillus castaneae]|uniref:Gfo/Idh/MocA family protein n=1 Tax=Paenibacillus castaneae TaxID=474957 RepID=UPI000C9CFB92|nr:Gfo/Idh/MocA family oxidoreductase [Paenibacillus castaneae]NIK75368.1 putative dehydrogenase [Paenibacillus castaneae]
MKALLVGFGSFGDGWYRRLRDRGLLAAVVEKNPAMKNKMGDDLFPFYESLEEAFEQVEFDFIVNVTPPSVHTGVNMAAFDRRIPVLCEKPIANEYEEAIQVVRRAERENIPFMIAENYRFAPNVRKMKELIEAGTIGELSVIDIGFFRYHHVKRNYPVNLLRDIGIHHMDMIRYLTSKEGLRIQARLYNPPGGWDEEGAILNASMFLEMEGGIVVNYSASITSRGPSTPWSANWRIEGTKGAIELIDQNIYVTVGLDRVLVDVPADVIELDCLQEFINSLNERRDGETSGKDYLLTQTLVHYAELSNQACRMLDIAKG